MDGSIWKELIQFQETIAEGTKKRIEMATEAIFNVLYHEGDMDLQEVRRKVNGSTSVFDMAVGALVEKGDVQLFQYGDSFILHRTDPAPAIFPLRGN